MTEHPHQFPQPIELPVDERESALPLSAQLTRFIITGGFSAIVDFGLLVILMALGLGHTSAKALSFIAGTTTAYLINRRWTFRASPSTRRFIAVVVLYAVTFALQVGLFSVLFTLLTAQGLGRLPVQIIAFVIAQGVATTVNFIVQRSVIFKLQGEVCLYRRSRYGSRAAVVRRREGTRFSSPSDDEVGGHQARSARSER
jgi:putative flippase GtrA